MKSAIDVLRSARAQPDTLSLFQRVTDAGAGEPDAVIAAVRILKSVKPKLPVKFYQYPDEGFASAPLSPEERLLRNSIIERAVTLGIHTGIA